MQTKKIIIPIILVSLGLSMFHCKDEEADLCGEEVFCQLNFYPNPVTDTLKVSFLSDNRLNANFELFDINGRTLFHQTLDVTASENELLLNLDTLYSGVYVIRIESEMEDQLTGKLVKE